MLTKLYGRGGGGRVAIVLSFYFDDPSLNPDIVHNFYGKVVWKELKRGRVGFDYQRFAQAI